MGRRPRRRHLGRFGVAVMAVGALLTVSSVAGSHEAQSISPSLPSGFVIETLVSGLSLPTALAEAPDGSLFIAEKSGVVKHVDQGSVTTFVDLSERVNSVADRGLLGLAVHPEFPVQPFVYTSYTYDPPETANQIGFGQVDQPGMRVSRVTRHTADPAAGHRAALTGSETVLIGTNSTWANIIEPFSHHNDTTSWTCRVDGEPDGAIIDDCLPADSTLHSVGGLRFGSDGSLFVATGDAAGFATVDVRATRALDVDSLAGKLLRVDPGTGEGLADNPHFDPDEPASNASRVWSRGLRNPYRFALHPDTDRPFIGDVGWEEWEELNVGKGANHGWPCFEGGDGTNLPQPGYSSLAACEAYYATGQPTAPLWDYPHAGRSRAIIAGPYHSGNGWPAAYDHALFVHDYARGTIRYLTFDTQGRPTVRPFATGTSALVDIIEGANGDLYFVDIVSGEVGRIHYTAADRLEATPRSIAFGASPIGVPVTAEISLANLGGAGDGPVVVAELAFSGADADAFSTTTSTPFTIPLGAGVDVPVTFSAADVSSATAQLAIRSDGTASPLLVELSGSGGNRAPTPTITSPAADAGWRIGDVVTYAGAATDPEDGAIPNANLAWNVTIHHADHLHFDFHASTGSAGSFAYTDHDDDTYLELCLSATDSDGGRGTTCVDLHPNEVRYDFDAFPSGLRLTYNGRSMTTPFSVLVPEGADRIIVAPTHENYSFAAWSIDGPAAQHITIGGTREHLAAKYRMAPADETPPTQPTGLAAEVTETTITLSWNPATDDVAVASYDIYRDDIWHDWTTEPRYTDAGLAPGETHSYRVTAIDTSNNSSGWSPAVTATTR